MRFDDLQLSAALLRAVASEGYTVATPIQEQAIPLVLAGRDVLGCAQTGTGKTAAFALPILQRLSSAGANGQSVSATPEISDTRHQTPDTRRDSRSAAHGRHNAPAASGRRPRCLVLCPTRELAVQIGQSFRTYGKNLHVSGVVVFGGVGQNPQVTALRHGVDVVVATPGRLLDLMNQKHADLRGIEVLVLDEADRMLDMGFIPDIRRIVAHIPKERQTLLFSATMPAPIRHLADSLLRNPANVQVAPPASTVDSVEQSVYFVERRLKPALLAHLVENLPMTQALVFTRTKHGADRVVRHLHQSGIRAEAIHGNKSQNLRQKALENFRNYKTPVLVATDIASRGIDVDGITHVVNYDLTHEPETYVHRIGRTARAGATGSAVSFCDREELPNLRAIERLIRRPIPVQPTPGARRGPTPADFSPRPGSAGRGQAAAFDSGAGEGLSDLAPALRGEGKPLPSAAARERGSSSAPQHGGAYSKNSAPTMRTTHGPKRSPDANGNTRHASHTTTGGTGGGGTGGANKKLGPRTLGKHTGGHGVKQVSNPAASHPPRPIPHQSNSHGAAHPPRPTTHQSSGQSAGHSPRPAAHQPNRHGPGHQSTGGGHSGHAGGNTGGGGGTSGGGGGSQRSRFFNQKRRGPGKRY